MSIIYRALLKKLPIECLLKGCLSSNKLKVYYDILLAYREAGYDDVQLKEIALGLKDDLNIFKYAKQELSGTQMREIRIALKYDIDLFKYINKDMSVSKIQEIRYHLMYDKH